MPAFASPCLAGWEAAGSPVGELPQLKGAMADWKTCSTVAHKAGHESVEWVLGIGSESRSCYSACKRLTWSSSSLTRSRA